MKMCQQFMTDYGPVEVIDDRDAALLRLSPVRDLPSDVVDVIVGIKRRLAKLAQSRSRAPYFWLGADAESL